jgi:hypothetical protein
MAEGKKKFIIDSVRVILGRAEDLEKELARKLDDDPSYPHHASDRSAILEAKHLARLVGSLSSAPYHRDPYEVACERWMKGIADHSEH